MKKKIAILGSTGSIGKTLVEIIKKDKKNFEIVLLSAEENYKELLKQAKFFKVKNIVINNKASYLKIKKDRYSKKVKIFNNFNNFNKIFKKKIDYVMSSISGIEGFKPTIEIIKYTKKIAIANKEAIICGWDLIEKELKKNKTDFIPVDSEHFSIWYALKDINKQLIDKIYLTASGGPFLNKPLKLNNIKIKQAIKHPNWKMGKKISIDSATMMNKVFEIIEAKKIFKIPYKKLSILIHPKSYVHAIVKFNNGITKLLIHDTDMKIPIINSMYDQNNINSNSAKLNLNYLNNLNFSNVDEKKFPSIKILKTIPNINSLYETILVSANDELVNLFLRKKIKFLDIVNKLSLFIKRKEFIKYKYKYPKNSRQIKNLARYVRLKVNSLCI